MDWCNYKCSNIPVSEFAMKRQKRAGEQFNRLSSPWRAFRGGKKPKGWSCLEFTPSAYYLQWEIRQRPELWFVGQMKQDMGSGGRLMHKLHFSPTLLHLARCAFSSPFFQNLIREHSTAAILVLFILETFSKLPPPFLPPWHSSIYLTYLYPAFPPFKVTDGQNKLKSLRLPMHFQ